jgi:hypothetical protein
MNNLYKVISEKVWHNGKMTQIVELVVARTREQARYMAWKEKVGKYESNMMKIPNFCVKLIKKGVSKKNRFIASKMKNYKKYWEV